MSEEAKLETLIRFCVQSYMSLERSWNAMFLAFLERQEHGVPGTASSDCRLCHSGFDHWKTVESAGKEINIT